MFQCSENFSTTVATVSQVVLMDFMMLETENVLLFMQNPSIKERFIIYNRPEVESFRPEVMKFDGLKPKKRMRFAEIMTDVTNVYEWTFLSDAIFTKDTSSKLDKILLLRKRYLPNIDSKNPKSQKKKLENPRMVPLNLFCE